MGFFSKSSLISLLLLEAFAADTNLFTDFVFRGTVSSGGLNPGEILLKDATAYVANNNLSEVSLGTIDISNPKNAIFRNSVSIPNSSGLSAIGFTVSGITGYFTCGGGGPSKIGIFDLSTPSIPVLVGQISTSSVGFDVLPFIYNGTTGYLAGNDSSKVAVFDLSTPLNLSIQGLISEGLSYPNSSCIHGSTLYFTNGGAPYLTAFDIAVPGTITLRGTTAIADSNNRMVIRGTTAFVISTNGNLISVVDISSLASPIFEGSISSFGSAPSQLAVHGTTLYVMNRVSNSLSMYDVSLPATASFLGTVSSGGLQPVQLQVSESVGYVLNNGSKNIAIFALSNGTASLLSTVTTGGNNPLNLALNNQAGYVSNYSSSSVGYFTLDPSPSIWGTTTQNALWQNPANWEQNNVPLASSKAIFPGSITAQPSINGASVSVGSIDFYGSTTIVGTGSMILNPLSGTCFRIQAPVVLGTGSTLRLQSSGIFEIFSKLSLNNAHIEASNPNSLDIVLNVNGLDLMELQNNSHVDYKTFETFAIGNLSITDTQITVDETSSIARSAQNVNFSNVKILNSGDVAGSASNMTFLSGSVINLPQAIMASNFLGTLSILGGSVTNQGALGAQSSLNPTGYLQISGGSISNSGTLGSNLDFMKISGGSVYNQVSLCNFGHNVNTIVFDGGYVRSMGGSIAHRAGTIQILANIVDTGNSNQTTNARFGYGANTVIINGGELISRANGVSSAFQTQNFSLISGTANADGGASIANNANNISIASGRVRAYNTATFGVNATSVNVTGGRITVEAQSNVFSGVKTLDVSSGTIEISSAVNNKFANDALNVTFSGGWLSNSAQCGVNAQNLILNGSAYIQNVISSASFGGGGGNNLIISGATIVNNGNFASSSKLVRISSGSITNRGNLALAARDVDILGGEWTIGSASNFANNAGTVTVSNIGLNYPQGAVFAEGATQVIFNSMTLSNSGRLAGSAGYVRLSGAQVINNVSGYLAQGATLTEIQEPTLLSNSGVIGGGAGKTFKISGGLITNLSTGVMADSMLLSVNSSVGSRGMSSIFLMTGGSFSNYGTACYQVGTALISGGSIVNFSSLADLAGLVDLQGSCFIMNHSSFASGSGVTINMSGGHVTNGSTLARSAQSLNLVDGTLTNNASLGTVTLMTSGGYLVNDATLFGLNSHFLSGSVSGVGTMHLAGVSSIQNTVSQGQVLVNNTGGIGAQLSVNHGQINATTSIDAFSSLIGEGTVTTLILYGTLSPGFSYNDRGVINFSQRALLGSTSARAQFFVDINGSTSDQISGSFLDLSNVDLVISSIENAPFGTPTIYTLASFAAIEGTFNGQTLGTITYPLSVPAPYSFSNFQVFTSGTTVTVWLDLPPTTEKTWDNDTGNQRWQTNANWSVSGSTTQSPPTVADIAYFNQVALSNPQIQIEGTAEALALVFKPTAQDFIFSGGSLYLNSAQDAITCHGIQTFLNPVILTSNSTLTNYGALNFQSLISASGRHVMLEGQGPLLGSFSFGGVSFTDALSVTMQNGSMTNSGQFLGEGTFTLFDAQLYNMGDVGLEGHEFVFSNAMLINSGTIGNLAKRVILEDGTISNFGVIAPQSSQLFITSAQVTNSGILGLLSGSGYGAVAISGGSFTNSYNRHIAKIEGTAFATLSISGGTFNNYGFIASIKNNSRGVLSVTGGSFSNNDPVSYLGFLQDTAQGDIYITGGSFYGKGRTAVLGDSSLGTVTIGGGNFYNNNGAVALVESNARGSLNILNGNFVNTSSGGLAFLRDAAQASIAISGGTFSNFSSGLALIYANSRGVISITGGHFTNIAASNIASTSNFGQADISISGGIFNNNYGFIASMQNFAKGTVDISGGSFSNQANSHIARLLGTAQADIRISGGTFNNLGGYIVSMENTAQGTLTINGGVFTNKAGYIANNVNGKMRFVGGTIHQVGGYFGRYSSENIHVSGSAYLMSDANSQIGPSPFDISGGQIINHGTMSLAKLTYWPNGTFTPYQSYSLISGGSLTGSGQLWVAGYATITAPVTQNTVYVGKSFKNDNSSGLCEAHMFSSGSCINALVNISGSGSWIVLDAQLNQHQIVNEGKLSSGTSSFLFESVELINSGNAAPSDLNDTLNSVTILNSSITNHIGGYFGDRVNVITAIDSTITNFGVLAQNTSGSFTLDSSDIYNGGRLGTASVYINMSNFTNDNEAILANSNLVSGTISGAGTLSFTGRNSSFLPITQHKVIISQGTLSTTKPIYGDVYIDNSGVLENTNSFICQGNFMNNGDAFLSNALLQSFEIRGSGCMFLQGSSFCNTPIYQNKISVQSHGTCTLNSDMYADLTVEPYASLKGKGTISNLDLVGDLIFGAELLDPGRYHINSTATIFPLARINIKFIGTTASPFLGDHLHLESGSEFDLTSRPPLLYGTTQTYALANFNTVTGTTSLSGIPLSLQHVFNLELSGSAVNLVANYPNSYTVTWIGPNPGDWHSPMNWDTGFVPSQYDTAFFNSPGGVVLLGNAQVAKVTFSGADEFTLSGGTIGLFGSGIESSGSQKIMAAVVLNNSATISLLSGSLTLGELASLDSMYIENFPNSAYADLTIKGTASMLIAPNSSLAKGINSVRIEDSSLINQGLFAELISGTLTFSRASVTNQNIMAYLSRHTEFSTNAISLDLSNLDGTSELANDYGALFGPTELSMSNGLIRNHGTLALRGTSNINQGAITGSGALLVAGHGKISTSVTQKTIFVGKTIGVQLEEENAEAMLFADGIIQSDLVITGSGSFFGKGTVMGDVIVKSGGYLSPGGLLDITESLKVTGSMICESNSLTQIDFDGSSNDEVVLYGQKLILGAAGQNPKLLISALGPFASGSRYTIFRFDSQDLQSSNLNGVILGRFDVETNQPLLGTNLIYSSSGVDLVIETNSFTMLAQTPNQQAVAYGLDSLNGHTNPCLQDKIDQLLQASAPEIVQALNSLESSEFKGQQFVIEQMSFTVNNAVNHQLYNYQKGYTPFLIGGYDKLNQKSFKQYNGFISQGGYQLLGITVGINKWQALAALGSFQTALSYKKTQATSSSASLAATFGLCCIHPRLFYGLDVLFNYHFINTRRLIEPFGLHAQSNHGANNFKFETKIGYLKRYHNINFVPYEQFGYNILSENGFTEHGASCLSLKTDPSKRSMFRNTLGLRIQSKKQNSKNFLIQPFIDTSWVWEYRFNGKNYRSEFINTQTSMHIEGLVATKNYGKLETGFEIKNQKFSSKLNFNGMWGRDYSELGLSLSLDRNF